jgi:putative PIN family toxin of toxin-antitoxin system
MRRAVFDTTVLISAFLRPGGLADELLTLAAEDQFELVLSSAIIIETWRTLVSSDHIRARYPFSDERVHIFCLSLSQISADVLRSTTPLAGVVRDPNDDMIIAAAIDGRADTIVSRDKDLLSLGAFQGVPIISPEPFRHQLREADRAQ